MSLDKKRKLPPRWIDRFLRWRLPEEQFEEVQGDMHELYNQWVEEMGERKANWMYLLNALTFLRPLPKRAIPYHQKTNQYSKINSFDMISNYFKIACRNIVRHKAFSFLNIVGLAIGMTCSILILLWVTDELSYDRFHTNADRLYRITMDAGDIQAAVTVPGIAAALQAQLPEVKSTVRLSKYHTHLLEVDSRKFEEQRIFYADSNFLSVFTFPLIKGDVRTALNHPDGIIITQAMAQKYFGEEEALGKTIRKDNRDNLVVSGVLANVPANSHLQFDFLLPMAHLARTDEYLRENQWAHFNFLTYVELHESIEATPAFLQKLSGQISHIYKGHHSQTYINFRLQPLTRIHLHSNLFYDLPGHGNIGYVRIFSVVAIFILLVACINFMNLATARSARRAKEVGLRKVVGARRQHLIAQFMGESLLIAGIALLLAMIFVWLLLPAFNDLSGKQLTIDFLDSQWVLGLLAISLFTGLLSGSYPALFLSAFQPVKVLKGALSGTNSGVLLRNGLVVAQFVVSIMLLVGTAVVYQQISFIQHRNLGFDKQNLLYVPMRGELWSNYPTLRTQLAQNPLTSQFTISEELPTNLSSATANVKWQGKAPGTQPTFNHIAVDENFIDVFGMQLLSGRSFSKEFKADTTNFIVNEKTLGVMGIDAASAVGKSLSLGDLKGTIIGVVKDFNFKPIQQPIEPLILRLNTWGGFVVVRTKPGSTQATIQALEKICRQLNPAYPFAYNFLDQDLANLYQAEKRMGNLFNVFAGLAIFISCLGLYGLSAFVAERRTKEISIRKVLGASVPGLVGLLSKDFLKLVFLAFVIATPLAAYVMHQWLEGFAYHIDLAPWMFALAGCLALLIALLTVSYQAIKAAIANPVRSLRNE